MAQMVTKVSNKQAFRGTINLYFENAKGKRTQIDNKKIIYIMIDYHFDNSQVLPVIYLSLYINSQLYNDMINDRGRARFYLNIKSTNILSNTSVSKDILTGYFNYIPSTTNPDYYTTINEKADGLSDGSYKQIMIGLVSDDQTNMLRVSFNNIYQSITQQTLISIVTQGLKSIVIAPFDHDITYDQFMLTPQTSVYRAIDFIFESDPFYDTNFRFFMDFDTAYLLSKSGLPVDSGDTNPNSIIFDIRDVEAQEAYMDGVEIINDAYYVYIPPTNAKTTDNYVTEKVANNITVFNNDNDDTNEAELDVNLSQKAKKRNIFVRADNNALHKNEIESDSMYIQLLKQNIDGNIFSPNKKYTVKSRGRYSIYNGIYILDFKRVFYKNVNGQFLASCNLGLKRIRSITTNNGDDNKVFSDSARRTSSSNQKSKSNVQFRG